MRRRTLIRLIVSPVAAGAVAVGVAAAGALAGCGPAVPGEPFLPIAVRLSGDTVEVVHTDCNPVGVEQVFIVRPDPKDTVIKDSDPVVWRENFHPPSTAASFTAGATHGDPQDVPLAAPLDRDTSYAAFLKLANGTSAHASFQLSKLAGGRVSHDGRYQTAEEFAKEWPCRSR